MKKIILFCAGGMSTSILVKNIKKSAMDHGFEVSVEAHPVSSAKVVGPAADLVLLAPQVRFQEKNIRKALPDVNLEIIDMRTYGRMDGEKIVKDFILDL